MRGKTARETTAAGDEVDRQLADRRLFARLRDERDPVDRDAVVERFLPLARQLAARYQRAGEPFDDVFQVACFGLVKAVDRFDADRGVAFSSYAVPTITARSSATSATRRGPCASPATSRSSPCASNASPAT